MSSVLTGTLDKLNLNYSLNLVDAKTFRLHEAKHLRQNDRA